MGSPGHKGGQSRTEIARNLEYVEELTEALVTKHGEKLVEMYRTMKRKEMADILLPGVNEDAAKSALRDAIAQLMDPEERLEIQWQRQSENGKKHARMFTDEERARGRVNVAITPARVRHLAESRGHVLWTEAEEQLLVDMMKAGVHLSIISVAVTSISAGVRTLTACRTQWNQTTLIPEEEKRRIAHDRLSANGRAFTSAERARSHVFDDADRVKAREALGVIRWSGDEDAMLIELRKSGKTFREIALTISEKFGTDRSTAGCISRYYITLKLGTKKRRKRTTAA